MYIPETWYIAIEKASVMHNTEIEKTTTHPGEPKTISGILLSALDMEDDIAHSVYRDYMDRHNWPADLREDVFEEIRKILTTLLNDTLRHRKIIKALQSRLDNHHG